MSDDPTRRPPGDQPPEPGAVRAEPSTATVPVAEEAPRRRTIGRVSPRTDAGADRTSVLRVPSFSPLAGVLGWVLAWGAIAIATTSLQRAGVETGFQLGIADGGPRSAGFWAGVWLLVVSAGAFLLGGYAAARIARANGSRHAVLVWVVAMIATGADAVVEALREGSTGVIQLIPGVPYWIDTGLSGRAEAVIVLAIFAAAGLVGALVGGALGQAANKVDRTDDVRVSS